MLVIVRVTFLPLYAPLMNIQLVYRPRAQPVRCFQPEVRQGRHEGQWVREPLRHGDRPREFATRDDRAMCVQFPLSLPIMNC